MHLFTDYIQPITTWLHTHPHWALFFTFIVSLSESLAVVGSIVPGSICMTAVGILAGSGVMRIDLTMIAAILGAIAGDAFSYLLGYGFSEQLMNRWPFKRYPNWINYGRDYFAKHGATSVLIGRFFGPLRPIIPMIAGMMRMNKIQFFVANILSAIGWSFLYVMPGVLIGAASSELSPESATRLFIFILIILAILWVTGIALKWLFVHTHFFLTTKLHRFWLHLKNTRSLHFIILTLTPPNEKQHHPTAGLVILFLMSTLLFILLCVLSGMLTWAMVPSQMVYLFFQSIRTHSFDAFFVFINFFIEPPSLAALILTTTLYALYFKDWRTLRYWISLVLTSLVFSTLFSKLIPLPSPPLTLHAMPLFPARALSVATTLLGFLILYMSTHYHTLSTKILRSTLLMLLCFNGLGYLYLGDNLLNSVLAAYSLGLSICLLHWVYYRRQEQVHKRPELPIVLASLMLFLTGCLYAFMNFNAFLHVHAPELPYFRLNEANWWNKPTLPQKPYTTTRLGRPLQFLQIQYKGTLDTLENALTQKGWKKHQSSFAMAILTHVGEKSTPENTPLKSHFYRNKKAVCIFVYQPKGQVETLVLRFWPSSYYIGSPTEPLWYGSIETLLNKKTQQNGVYTKATQIEKLFKKSLPEFDIKRKPVQLQNPLPSPLQEHQPVLILIKEAPAHSVGGRGLFK